MPTYISENLENKRMISFNAGDHQELIRMPYQRYKELVEPKVLDFNLK